MQADRLRNNSPIVGLFALLSLLERSIFRPVGEGALYVLAIALSAAFGCFGVVLGLAIAVRSINRDESRFGDVTKLCERVVADHQQLRLEWAKTIENLTDLDTSIERKRRRAAASLSAVDRKDREIEPELPLSAREEREEARKRLRRVM